MMDILIFVVFGLVVVTLPISLGIRRRRVQELERDVREFASSFETLVSRVENALERQGKLRPLRTTEEKGPAHPEVMETPRSLLLLRRLLTPLEAGAKLEWHRLLADEALPVSRDISGTLPSVYVLRHWLLTHEMRSKERWQRGRPDYLVALILLSGTLSSAGFSALDDLAKSGPSLESWREHTQYGWKSPPWMGRDPADPKRVHPVAI